MSLMGLQHNQEYALYLPLKTKEWLTLFDFEGEKLLNDNLEVKRTSQDSALYLTLPLPYCEEKDWKLIEKSRDGETVYYEAIDLSCHMRVIEFNTEKTNSEDIPVVATIQIHVMGRLFGIYQVVKKENELSALSYATEYACKDEHRLSSVLSPTNAKATYDLKVPEVVRNDLGLFELSCEQKILAVEKAQSTTELPIIHKFQKPNRYASNEAALGELAEDTVSLKQNGNIGTSWTSTLYTKLNADVLNDLKIETIPSVFNQETEGEEITIYVPPLVTKTVQSSSTIAPQVHSSSITIPENKNNRPIAVLHLHRVIPGDFKEDDEENWTVSVKKELTGLYYVMS